MEVGKTDNQTLRAQARESLNGKWRPIIVVTIMLSLPIFILSMISVLGTIIDFLLFGVVWISYLSFFLPIARNKKVRVNTLFSGFKRYEFYTMVYLQFLLKLIIGTIIFIIPGLIAKYRYQLVPFVIADNPNITNPADALNKCKILMEGNKWRLFSLQMSFIGWWFLSVLTFGIGFLWLVPYMNVTFAKLYDDISSGKVTGGRSG